MLKKFCFLLLVVAVWFAFSGCNTIQGAAQGFSEAGKNIAQGVKEDWQAAKRWDKKFREKYW